MLRLEKKRGENPVHIVFRKPERLLTPGLIQAFVWALALHGFALFFFQVQPFQIRKIPPPFPPLKVKIEKILPKKNQSTLYTDIEEQLIEKKLPRPVWSKPEKPVIARTIFSPRYQTISLPNTKNFSIQDPFKEMLENVRFNEEWLWEGMGRQKGRWQKDEGKEVSRFRNHHAFYVSGPLSKRKAIKGKAFSMLPLLKEEEEAKLCFKVIVDNRSGEVIFYTLENVELWESVSGRWTEKNPMRNPLLRKKTATEWIEKFFQMLHFEPILEGYMTEGWVSLSLKGTN